jgi:cell division protein FtsI (penicillin-binding protein 3)
VSPPRRQRPRRRPSRRVHQGPTRQRSAPSSNRKRRRPPTSLHARRRSASGRRLVALFVVLTLAFVAVAARLVILQIVNAPAYAQLAADQRKREITFAARRGAIFDRDGAPLGISVDLQTIFADPALVEDPAGEAEQLAPVLGEKRSVVEEKLRGSPDWSRFEYLLRHAEPEIAARIRDLRLPGVFMRPEAKRVYPNGRLGSHLLGFTNIDGDGLAGIEVQYDDILEGEPGRMVLEQDPSGRALPQAEFSYERARPGRSLFLTLDKELQYFTELTLEESVKMYDADAGSAIVMKPDTGEILAMASVPDFDPNRPGEFSNDLQRNRAITDLYEPGSAYKIVTASAALNEGVVTPRTRFVVPDAFAYSDRVFNDSHPHATESMTVAQIIRDSSNVGTIKIGLEVGGKRLQEYIKRFGFGTRTGLDFPGEAPGIVLPRPQWSGTTIATIPIGQGIAVTALQMISAFATIANDGVAIEPKLLYATMRASGRVVGASEPAYRRVITARTAGKMNKILQQVVDEGTGTQAQIPGYRVAGKTGTAQKPLPTGGYGNSYTASFGGFAPADDPEIVAIVVLDDPSPIWGGWTAAPTFRTIVEFSLRHLGVSPTGNAEKAAREIEAERNGDDPTYD